MAADDSRPSVRRAFSTSFLMSTASACTLEFLTSSNSSSGCLAASIPVQGVLLAQPAQDTRYSEPHSPIEHSDPIQDTQWRPDVRFTEDN